MMKIYDRIIESLIFLTFVRKFQNNSEKTLLWQWINSSEIQTICSWVVDINDKKHFLVASFSYVFRDDSGFP